MHLPDAWGYLVFGGEKEVDEAPEVPRDSTWPARLAAVNVYYAQQAYKQKTGSYASRMDQLSELVNQAIVAPFQIEIQMPRDFKKEPSE